MAGEKITVMTKSKAAPDWLSRKDFTNSRAANDYCNALKQEYLQQTGQQLYCKMQRTKT